MLAEKVAADLGVLDRMSAPEVRRRFAEMADLHEGRFDQPVRISPFQSRRAQSEGAATDCGDSRWTRDVAAGSWA